MTDEVKEEAGSAPDPHLSDSCRYVNKEDKAPKGAVYRTPTQYLDKNGQPLAPPVDLDAK